MASRRMISSDLFEDDFIGQLNYFERLLWIGLITAVADDQGRMMDNPALIRTRVFLYDTVDDVTVERALSKIAAEGKIVRYVAGNKHLVQIVNWWKYQTPSWASPSKFPAPEGWMDRTKYHTAGNKVASLNWDKTGGYAEGYVGDYVPMVDRPIEDGDVKSESEVNIARQPKGDAFDNMRDLVETVTGYPPRPADVEAIKTFVRLGVTEADLREAMSFLDGKKKVYGASDLLGSATTAHSKRIQGGARTARRPQPAFVPSEEFGL